MQVPAPPPRRSHQAGHAGRSAAGRGSPTRCSWSRSWRMTRVVGFVVLARLTGPWRPRGRRRLVLRGAPRGQRALPRRRRRARLVVWARISLASLGWRADELGPDRSAGVAGRARLLRHRAPDLDVQAGRASAAETLQGWWQVSLPERLLGLLIGVEAALTEETPLPGQPPADPCSGMLARGAGLLLTAILFALYHLRFELWGLLGKTAFGLVFGHPARPDRPAGLPGGGALAHLGSARASTERLLYLCPGCLRQ
jgi:hypothetical protein